MSYRVLVVPGFHGSGEAHWQTWLEKQLPLGGVRLLSGNGGCGQILGKWRLKMNRRLRANASTGAAGRPSAGTLEAGAGTWLL